MWLAGVELEQQYDPKPPFDSGTPSVADPAVVAIVKRMLEAPNAEGLDIVRHFKERRLVPA